jgi:hypothetical protein
MQITRQKTATMLICVNALSQSMQVSYHGGNTASRPISEVKHRWASKTKCVFLLLFGQRQRGGARHSGAPMLRRYAATSALFFSMAYLSAV